MSRPEAPTFRQRAAAALSDAELRSNFRRAMDGLMEKRAARFPDPDEWRRLRALGASIRARALAKLPELLEKLEERCSRNGIRVLWAETAAEANALVLAILREHAATRVVKGKSMVSEEMHLNAFLEAHGVECVESDLGEYIVQRDGETPSHIIMPAIHKNRRQIARVLGARIREAKAEEEVSALTAIARRALRRKFFEAEAGVSGVNFAVAESGTLCLVENEGNGRMCTHVPPVHIALMGLEKVVERLEDVPPLYSLLCRSATGQAITTYFNMISGPRGAGERDGPHHVYLVILDNGRSRIFQDEELAATLRCIRCGACLNHCPVYSRVGGHAYAAVYPGPIGKILMPQIDGVGRRGDLIGASSLCGACAEVCPVEIPIARLIVRLRGEAVHANPASSVRGAGEGRNFIEKAAWRLWETAHRHPALYRVFGFAATRLGRFVPATLPRPARRTLHERIGETGGADA